jgi:hypothetical protein
MYALQSPRKLSACCRHGIKPMTLWSIPGMPIGAMGTAGQQVFRLVRRLREELKVNTSCGASNISFGMPNRRALTVYFLAMAASHGMTSAIMNPLHAEDMHAIFGANVLNGTDKHCKFWTNKFREMTAPSGAGGGRSRPTRHRSQAGGARGKGGGEIATRSSFYAFGQARAVSVNPVLQGRARLSISIGMRRKSHCGRCQVDVGEGEFAKHGIRSQPIFRSSRKPRSVESSVD